MKDLTTCLNRFKLADGGTVELHLAPSLGLHPPLLDHETEVAADHQELTQQRQRGHFERINTRVRLKHIHIHTQYGLAESGTGGAWPGPGAY